MAELSEVRDAVRERYAAAARAASDGAGGHCSSTVSLEDERGEQVFGPTLYDAAAVTEVPESAVNASLGCGVPTAVADLHAGETVLDLGSGAGADVLISAPPARPSAWT